MARPWKHPKTGVYWFRRHIPDDLRSILGQLEEKRSLETKDPDEAKRRFAKVLSEVDAQWANLRAGPVKLTDLEALQLAQRVYDNWLAAHRDNPSEQFTWHPELYDQLWTGIRFDSQRRSENLNRWDEWSFCLTQAGGHAERVAALTMIEPRADRPRAVTLGADAAMTRPTS